MQNVYIKIKCIYAISSSEMWKKKNEEKKFKIIKRRRKAIQ
jgi:hypothetical protein